jgi:predicted permease
LANKQLKHFTSILMLVVDGLPLTPLHVRGQLNISIVVTSVFSYVFVVLFLFKISFSEQIRCNDPDVINECTKKNADGIING